MFLMGNIAQILFSQMFTTVIQLPIGKQPKGKLEGWDFRVK